MERPVLIGVGAFRWVALVWVTLVALFNLHRLDHPAVVIAALVAMAAVTVTDQVALVGPGWRRAMATPLVVLEVLVATAVVAADGWVQQGRTTGQSLAGTWPLAAILLVAVVAGPYWGGATGALIGSARALATWAGGVSAGQAGRSAVATAGTVLFWVAIGVVCGVIVRLLRRSQEQLAEATVRERMARDLHDGVLQTLALIERRSTSPDIARLAREQERELRAYLFDDHRQPATIAVELREVAARAERTWPAMAVTVTVSDDVPVLGADEVNALSGAAAEAITNAAKHGQATHAVVFADLDERSGGVFLTIKDDGQGYDPQTVLEGAGITQSIRGRVARIGGGVELAAHPGAGCEVRISLPAAGASGTRP